MKKSDIKQDSKLKKKNKKRKWLIFIMCLVLLLPVAVVYFVQFDFKYVKVKTKFENMNFSAIELVERSTTPGDSVCLVFDKKKYKGSCYFQRISSNRFATFKAEYSQRKFDFFTTMKNHFYDAHNEYRYALHFDRKYIIDEFLPKDYFMRMDSLKIQYYNVDKKKVEKEEELMPYLKKYDKNNALYGIKAKKTWFLKNNYIGMPVIFCNGKILQKNSEGYQVFYDEYSNDEKFKPYETESLKSEKTGYMNADTFKELMRTNKVKIDTYCFVSDPYCDLYISVDSSELPKKNAKLYKVYPKLKKYIGKQGKCINFYINGINNPDQLVEYFLPIGQKVSYGKKGLNLEKANPYDDYYKGKVCRNFQEYLDIQKQKETEK